MSSYLESVDDDPRDGNAHPIPPLHDNSSISSNGSLHHQYHGSTDHLAYDSSHDNSSISSDGSWHRTDGDCICGRDSDSEWADEKSGERKNVKIEVDENICPHKQLHRAIRRHDCRMIRQLLEDGVQPCTKFRSSRSCFILAHESKFILKKFLEIEPSGINCIDSHGSTLLMLAVITYKINIFNFLCTYNPDANVQNYDADNVLHEVLKGRLYNDASIIKRILDLGIDVNLVEGDGETALEIAVKAGCNSRIIEMLLDKGATLPEPDLDEKTIVMHAIEDGGENFIQTVETLKVLFKHGADASAKDEKGHNAMYYLISECLPNALHVPYHAKRLNEILIELIERNCEVQGLHRTFQRSEIVNDDRLIRKIPVAYNVIALLVRYTRSIGLPKALVERSLYSKKLSSPYILSPLSACLVQLITDTHIGAEAGLEILDLAIQLILLGTDDVYQCAWQDLCSPDISLSLNFKYRTRAEYQASIARKLAIPDALFFAANMRIFNYVIALDVRITAEESTVYEVDLAVEELLRLLLRFWPHPPLLLMLLRVDPVWCPLLVTRTGFSSTTETGMLFMMQVLAKIGGSLPLGTRYYTILKSALQQMAERHDLCKSMLKMLLQLDGGIPTLRSLSRAAFRATVKKTCPTGLDFSEYRVLCQGGMVPLPPEVVNYLEYRV